MERFISLLLLLATFSLSLNKVGALSLTGSKVQCSQPDGEEIRIPGITDALNVKIKYKCVCIKGVGEGEIVENQCLKKLQNCHYVQRNTNSNETCTKECRPCNK